MRSGRLRLINPSSEWCSEHTEEAKSYRSLLLQRLWWLPFASEAPFPYTIDFVAHLIGCSRPIAERALSELIKLDAIEVVRAARIGHCREIRLHTRLELAEQMIPSGKNSDENKDERHASSVDGSNSDPASVPGRKPFNKENPIKNENPRASARPDPKGPVGRPKTASKQIPKELRRLFEVADKQDAAKKKAGRSIPKQFGECLLAAGVPSERPMSGYDVDKRRQELRVQLSKAMGEKASYPPRRAVKPPEDLQDDEGARRIAEAKAMARKVLDGTLSIE